MSIEIEGLEKISAKLEPGRSLRHVGEALKHTVDFVEQETERGAKPHPADIGKLSHGNNIRQELPGVAIPLEGRVFTNSPIVVAVDQGRPAGGKMPPIGLIENWAARHGIGLAAGRGRSKPSGFRMARSIARRGSKPVEFFKHAAAAGEKKVAGFLRDAARAIENDWKR